MYVIFYIFRKETERSNRVLIAFSCRSNDRIDFSMEICFFALPIEWEIEFLPKYNPSCNFIKRKIICALYVHYIQLSL